MGPQRPPSTWPRGGRSCTAGTRPPGTVKALRHALKNAKSGASGLGVYCVLDEFGQVIYAGRSKNMETRMAQSMKHVGGAAVVGFEMADKHAVCALEQLGIELVKGKWGDASKNIINGISATNKNAEEYWKALSTLIKSLK